MVWLVIAPELRLFTLYTDSYAVPKGLALWLGRWEAKGWMIMNKPLWGQKVWEDI